MEIHEFMDSSKAAFPDNRHRALTHNSWFVGVVLPRVFGETFRRKSDNKIVCTRDIGEQHCLEDYKFKFMPSAQDFLQEMEFLPWMQNGMGEVPSSHKKIDGKTILKTKKVEKDLIIESPEDSKPETPGETLPYTGTVIFDGQLSKRNRFGKDDGHSMVLD